MRSNPAGQDLDRKKRCADKHQDTVLRIRRKIRITILNRQKNFSLSGVTKNI
jgi:hypothetical protein